MAISKLQYEEAETREELVKIRALFSKYTDKVNKYTYMRELLKKDYDEKMQRLEEIKRELNRGGE